MQARWLFYFYVGLLHSSLFPFKFQLNGRDMQRGFIKLSKRMLITYLIGFIAFSGVGLGFLFNPFGGVGEAEAAWFNDGWGFRKVLTIDESQVSGSSNLTNFPVLVSLSADASLSANAQADGDDFRFTTQNGEILIYEIESYSSGTLTAWVLMPSLSATTNTSIVMYYGNPSVGTTENENAVWESNYKMVHHLEESVTDNQTSGSHTDSTVNGFTGTQNNNGSITGQVDGGQDFDGTDDYIGIATGPNIANQSFTVEAWAKRETTGTEEHIFAQGNVDSANQQLNFGFNDSNNFLCGFYADDAISSGTFTDSDWHHWVCSYNASTNERIIYQDGEVVALSGGGSASADYQGSGIFKIGADHSDVYDFDGGIDEVRVSVGVRSEDWIVTQYNNQSDPSSFYATGSEEKASSPLAYWKFDEGQGTTASDSGSSRTNGTLGAATAEPSWIPEDQCISGKCLRFDGLEDTVSVASNPNLTTNLTFSAWIKRKSGSWVTIYNSGSQANYWSIGINGDDNFYIAEAGVQNYESTATIPENEWAHITVVKNGDGASNISLYKNGILAGTGSAGSFTAPSGTADIGSDEGAGSYWPGDIDEVKIYNYARSSAQVLADYNAQGNPDGVSAQLGGSQNMPGALSNGLVGYWKMDEAAWTSNCSDDEVLDYSGNGYHAESCPNGAANDPVVGKFGNAGSFDGSNDYVNPDNFNLNGATAFTASAWVNFSNVAERYVMGSDSQFDIRVTANNIAFSVATGGGFTVYRPTVTLAASTWNHIVGVYDGANMTVYLNGNRVNAQAKTGTVSNQGVNGFNIGSNTSGTGFMTGSVDEVRVYTRALSGNDVSQLYNWAPGPVGYWKLDDKTGTTTIDSSGNGINGTLNDGPVWINGKYGNAVSFDGGNDDISLTSSQLEISSSITVEAWVYPEDTGAGDYNGIFSSGAGSEGFYFEIINDGGSEINRLALWENGGGFSTANNVIVPNRWQHVAAVVDNNASTIYVNGVVVGTGTYTLNAEGNDSFWIGSYDGSGEGFNGDLDEVKVFNYPRTSAQIISSMNGGHPAPGSPVGSALGHWRFDEGFGDTANNSGNGGSVLNGNLAGSCPGAGTCPTWSNAGKVNKALSFDGGDYMVVPDHASLEPANQVTVTLWAKPASAPQSPYASMVSKRYHYFDSPYNSYQIGYSVDGTKFDFGLSTGGTLTELLSNATVTTDWTHIAIVYDGATMKLYLNGKLDNSVAKTGDIDYSAVEMLFGSTSTTPDETYNGLLDEVKVFTTALTADQIKLAMNQSSAQVMGALSTTSAGVAMTGADAEYCVPGDATSCTGPVVRMDLNEGTGTAVNNTGSVQDQAFSLTGAVWDNGKIGGGVRFDGTDDKVGHPAEINVQSQQMTVEFWLNWDSFSDDDDVAFGLDDTTQTCDLYIQPNSSGASTFGVGIEGNAGFNEVGFTRPTAKVWHHYAMVFDINQAGQEVTRAYVDGIKQTLSTVASANNTCTFSNAADLQLMAFRDVGHGAGKMDQFRLFNYARTDAQILWGFNQGKPIAHWRMDECQGATIHDSSGNNYAGTLTIGAGGSENTVGTCTTSSTAWGDGAIGKRNNALRLDGTDDVITSTDIDITGSITLAAWVANNTNGDGSNRAIITKRDDGAGGTLTGYGFDKISSGALRFYWYSGGYTTSNSGSNSIPADGSWHHVAVTYVNGSAPVFYIDGRPVTGSGSSFPDLDTNDVLTTIGGPVSGEGFWSGKIDDARIYNYALTSIQVKTLYNEGSVKFGPNSGAP